MKSFGLINYGVGNIRSIYNMFNYLGLNIDIINNPLELKYYDKIILPGVGSFKHCMKEIKSKNFDEEIKNFVENKKILLGICVGMQILCSSSTEGGLTNGLNFFDEKIEKFNSNEVNGNPIPHIGFNTVFATQDSQLFKDFDKNLDFYFIHSYRLRSLTKKKNLSYFDYGKKFVSSLEKDNIFGVQFHPEKSQLSGIKFFYNFARI